jgi:hypothetical protein
MIIFTYRCPATGYRIEGHGPDPAAAGASPLTTYVAETCPACGGLHIVNPATGRLLSEEAPVSLRQIKAPPPEAASAAL